MTSSFFDALAREAADRYPVRDRFARAFAYSKLRRDPAFRHFLAQGLIPPGARILDLGAGQGLLCALLAATNEDLRHQWPADWAAAPRGTQVRGIEIVKRNVERARFAADATGELVHGDIRYTPFGAADVCILLDVLHYLEPAAQEDILRRARAALDAGGTLLVRVADGSRPMRFFLTLALDRIALALRGHFVGRFHPRPLSEWCAMLARLGFNVTTTPMGAGTPFSNTLLVARYDRAPATAP